MHLHKVAALEEVFNSEPKWSEGATRRMGTSVELPGLFRTLHAKLDRKTSVASMHTQLMIKHFVLHYITLHYIT